MKEISKGQFGNLPAVPLLGESANSGAAVALSAIQRKQNKMKNIETVATKAAAVASEAAKEASSAKAVVITPKGNDGKHYCKITLNKHTLHINLVFSFSNS